MEATIQFIEQELNHLYPKTEVRTFTRLIIEHVCGLNYTDQILLRKKQLDDSERAQIPGIIQRLKTYEPIQYVLGETEFWGLKLKVAPGVLIPRPETEELIQWITETGLPAEPVILDIGTGSGCIALALKKEILRAIVSAVDISENALEIARKNAVIHSLNVDFSMADILRWENRHWEMADLIVSNPPYIRESEKAAMLPNVLDYEPKEALFVPDSDPLLFYRKIAHFARKFLKKEGWLFFEINENLGPELAGMLKNEGFSAIKIKKDLFEKDRMLRCRI
jgi:release factor glutamine methyltransferase